jgi:energy-coupling factor transporter ATP-binding protein EcfA2
MINPSKINYKLLFICAISLVISLVYFYITNPDVFYVLIGFIAFVLFANWLEGKKTQEQRETDRNLLNKERIIIIGAIGLLFSLLYFYITNPDVFYVVVGFIAVALFGSWIEGKKTQQQDPTKQEEKNRYLLNVRIQSEARKLYLILTEYVGLFDKEMLATLRPLLLPFINLVCTVKGQEAKNYFEDDKNKNPDTWPADFIEKYGEQFMTLTNNELSTVPYSILKQFFLSVFSEPFDIQPKDLVITDENLKWCAIQYKEALEELERNNNSSGAKKQPKLSKLPITTEVAQEILFRNIIENRVRDKYRDFDKFCDDLRRRCTHSALLYMGKSSDSLVYGKPLERADNRSLAYSIHSALDCATQYKSDDLFRHTYIVGKTGSGKTTLLKTLISQHISAGQGVIILSPESDLFEAVLDCVPPHRADDVIYFDPVSSETPIISINPFILEKGEFLFERAGDVYATLEAAFGDLGESMKTLLFKCTFTLLQIPGANLQDLRRLLKPSPDFRQTVIANRNIDEETREWWRDTYGAKGSLYPKSAEALMRRLEAFSVPPLSSTIASASFNFSEALNMQKSIFLFNLSRLKGLQAEVTGQLLSSMVLQTLLARDAQKPQKRLPYHFIIDEFQTYAGNNAKSFIDIFNRARKYRMSVTLAHQVTANIPSELLSTIIGNAGTKIIMERPSEDAAMFAKELQIKSIDRDTYNASIFQNLEPHEFFLSTPKNKRGVILQTMFENYKPIEFPQVIRQDLGEQIKKDITVRSRKEWRERLTKLSRFKYGGVGRNVVEEAGATNAQNQQPHATKPATDDDPESRFSIR